MLDLLLGALAISFSAVFMKLVSVGPTTAGFYRMFFGGLLLALFLAWRRERPSAPGGRAWIFVAGLMFALDLVFWHRSIGFIGTGLATLLANFQVFLVGLASVLWLGERGDWRLAAAVPLALVGLALIVGVDTTSLEAERGAGIALGLLAAVCYASYLLALRSSRAAHAGSPTALVTLISLVSAAMLAVAVPLSGESFIIPSGRDLALLLGYGLVGQVLGWVLISRAMSKVPASRVALVLLLQPVFAYAWDVAFFGRGFLPRELLGAGLALAAIQLGATRRS